MNNSNNKSREILKTFEDNNILMTKAECEKLIRDLDNFYKSIIEQVMDYTKPNAEGAENE